MALNSIYQVMDSPVLRYNLLHIRGVPEVGDTNIK